MTHAPDNSKRAQLDLLATPALEFDLSDAPRDISVEAITYRVHVYSGTIAGAEYVRTDARLHNKYLNVQVTVPGTRAPIVKSDVNITDNGVPD
ncbi:hypothetical protein [Burkholderia sp. ISTR5]|uniref:hypothetical protein n=1 Tax=Burkholderia sp. ISTR5 TaxID=2500161 RepID=UPI0013682723|nr:hypothetical protein [Burkholderia sp. ISTR5]NBI49238.1 hypothetical protein [Burkholderia sp. ISTR5]